VPDTWRITSGCRLLWKSWGGEHVVFNTGSASTHILDDLSAHILRSIEHRPSSIEGLVENLAPDLIPQASRQEIINHLENLLPSLHALALIEPDSK